MHKLLIMACDSAKKYAIRRLYGMTNCKDYRTAMEKYLFEQRVYKNSDCNIDTSCFESTECGTPAQAQSITCNITTVDSTSCTITITE
jgi:hypothetical protein